MMTKGKYLFSHQKMISICLVLLGLLLIVTICAPLIAPHDPATVNLAMKLKGSSWEYPLGTDQLGRCNLSRILYGARVSLG